MELSQSEHDFVTSTQKSQQASPDPVPSHFPPGFPLPCALPLPLRIPTTWRLPPPQRLNPACCDHTVCFCRSASSAPHDVWGSHPCCGCGLLGGFALYTPFCWTGAPRGSVPGLGEGPWGGWGQSRHVGMNVKSDLSANLPGDVLTLLQQSSQLSVSERRWMTRAEAWNRAQMDWLHKPLLLCLQPVVKKVDVWFRRE